MSRRYHHPRPRRSTMEMRETRRGGPASMVASMLRRCGAVPGGSRSVDRSGRFVQGLTCASEGGVWS
jgi:hypothetical protein